jgi:hypothetical protein
MQFTSILPQNLRITASPTFANIYDSGLTSGRITYAGTSGLLQDSSNLTFDGTNLTCVGLSTLTGGMNAGASATKLSIESDGDTFWTGDGTGVPYGDMYTNTTISVVISDNNPTEILDATSDGWTVGQTNLVTFPTGGDEHYISVDKAGRYLIVWSISCAQNSPTAAIELGLGIMVNGTAQNQGQTHRTIANATDKGNAGGTGILDLAADDQISLYIANETNTTNIDVEHANVSVVQIGGT